MVRNARPGEGQAGVRVERRVRADLRNDRVQRLRDRLELGPVVGTLGRPLGAVLLVLRMHPLVRDQVLGAARAHRLATQRAEQLAVRTCGGTAHGTNGTPEANTRTVHVQQWPSRVNCPAPQVRTARLRPYILTQVGTALGGPPRDLLDEALAVLLGDVQARLADGEVVPRRVPLAATLDHVLFGEGVQRTKLWTMSFGKSYRRTQHGHHTLPVLQVGYEPDAGRTVHLGVV